MRSILSVLVCSFMTMNIVISQETKVIENNPDYEFQSEKQQQKSTTAPMKNTYAYQPSWSFGGNLGLSFWNGGTDILIGPKAYYHVNPQFLTGFGFTYIYSSSDDSFGKYNQNSFGPTVMAAFRPVPYLQVSAEYEGLQTNGNSTIYMIGSNNIKNDYSFWNNALYLGASFVSRNVSFGLRYDVLYDSSRSVYGSAWSPVIGFYF